MWVLKHRSKSNKFLQHNIHRNTLTTTIHRSTRFFASSLLTFLALKSGISSVRDEKWRHQLHKQHFAATAILDYIALWVTSNFLYITAAWRWSVLFCAINVGVSEQYKTVWPYLMTKRRMIFGCTKFVLDGIVWPAVFHGEWLRSLTHWFFFSEFSIWTA